jgi:hypothetical protein
MYMLGCCVVLDAWPVQIDFSSFADMAEATERYKALTTGTHGEVTPALPGPQGILWVDADMERLIPFGDPDHVHAGLVTMKRRGHITLVQNKRIGVLFGRRCIFTAHGEGPAYLPL